MSLLYVALIVAVAVVVALAAIAWVFWRRTSAAARLMMRRIARLPLRHKLRLAMAMLRDRRVPLHVRAILPGLLLYLSLPLDLVPDFIPVLGQLDDLVVVLVGVGLLLRFAPRRVIEEHLARLEGVETA